MAEEDEGGRKKSREEKKARNEMLAVSMLCQFMHTTPMYARVLSSCMRLFLGEPPI